MFIASLGAGAIFERLQTRHNWTARAVRQCAQFIAFGGTGSLLLLCGFMNDQYTAYAFMALGQVIAIEVVNMYRR